jgi:hypothetical protein
MAAGSACRPRRAKPDVRHCVIARAELPPVPSQGVDAVFMSSQLYAISLMLIMTIGPLPDATGRHETGDSPRQNALDPGFHRARTGQQSYYALDPGIHYVRTRWIRRFIASERTGSGIHRVLTGARSTRTAMLMASACPESGLLGRTARPRISKASPCISKASLRPSSVYTASTSHERTGLERRVVSRRPRR